MLNGELLMEYSIYGSCVTRDIFSELKLDSYVKQYQARCSLHSKVSEPFEDAEIPTLIGIDSNWQKKMVNYDLKKNGLNLSSDDVLIVDFIDERFNIMKSGTTLMTQSKEFNDLDLASKLNCTKAFSRGTDLEFDFWKIACQKFKNSLPSPHPTIIVHKGIFALQYIGKDGLIDLPNREFNLEMNRRLEIYYSIFIEVLNPNTVISAPKELIIAEPNHKWGLAPFHYIQEYYEELWGQLTFSNL